MTKADGSELIAKVPCRIAGPAFLTTASEAGTLEYSTCILSRPWIPKALTRHIPVRKYTSIPVPRVFSWSPHNSNPVGAEYILMEKAAGIPLFERWSKMAEIDKLGLIKNLTQLEAQLAAISFPTYGGLYLRADADRLQHQNLDDNVDEQHLFCIGPSPDRSFDLDEAASLRINDESINNGPCMYLMLFMNTN